MKKKDKATVYIPPNARISIENTSVEPPTVKYEKRKKIIDREEVRKQIEKKP